MGKKVGKESELLEVRVNPDGGEKQVRRKKPFVPKAPEEVGS